MVFFFALACERIFIKTHSTESRCVIGPENARACLQGCQCTFSPELLQAGAVKGLIHLVAFFFSLSCSKTGTPFNPFTVVPACTPSAGQQNLNSFSFPQLPVARERLCINKQNIKRLVNRLISPDYFYFVSLCVCVCVCVCVGRGVRVCVRGGGGGGRRCFLNLIISSYYLHSEK